MSRPIDAATGDLLSGVRRPDPGVEALAEGATILRDFAKPEAAALLEMLQQVAHAAPFRRMETPGGYRMSVAMTNCGGAGWITDRRGYRYEALDPMIQSAPGEYRSLVVDRNRRWVKAILRRLKGGGEAVMVVGIGHLIGPNSVPTLLRARGVSVDGP